MAVICSLQEAHDRGLLAGACCAFGVFDGVHKGHCYIVDQACREARKADRAAIALTFDIDPDELFRADRLKKLMSNEQRIKRLAELGLDAVVVLPFTPEFAAQQPADFLESSFAGGIPFSMHVGFDLRFGARASGGLAELEEWGSARGMRVHGHDLLELDGKPVTSSRIRLLLAQGSIMEANSLLDANYCVWGEVQQGRGEGGDFGFKTANLHVPDMLKVLSDGVYAAYAYVDGKRFKAAVSNGVAPTFAGSAKANVEVHILDFEGDIYGKSICVEFIEWLRPMMSFPTLDELISTVMANIDWVRNNL